MFPKTLLAIVSYALVAQAQSSGTTTTTTSTAPASQSSLPAGLDTCIVGCLTLAVGASNCTSYTDISCVCSSSSFQNAAAACLQANCTTTDLETAQALQTQECNALSSGSSAASTAASTGTASASSASGATSSATSTSAAMALSAPFSFGSLLGTLVASAGALVGAAFVL